MYKLVRFGILGATLLAYQQSDCKAANESAPTSFQVAEQPASADVARFQAWMNTTGLSDHFDLIRIGSGPHPDPTLAMDSLIQHLELRFRDEASNTADKIAHFQEVLNQYQAQHSTGLPAKLFYEFVHDFALERLKACVDFHTGEVIYSTYVSRQDSSLIVRESGKRSPSRFSALIPPMAPQEKFTTRAGGQSLPTAKYVSDAVEKILTAYLIDADQRAGAKPDITPERMDGYLGLNVQGAKALVTDRFWEWMSIDVEFYPDPGSTKEQASQWTFFCHLNVKYASSPREKSPTDAESDYPMQVANFRKKLVDQLQRNLEKGIHD